jgi:hypothetical protein
VARGESTPTTIFTHQKSILYQPKWLPKTIGSIRKCKAQLLVPETPLGAPSKVQAMACLELEEALGTLYQTLLRAGQMSFEGAFSFFCKILGTVN